MAQVLQSHTNTRQYVDRMRWSGSLSDGTTTSDDEGPGPGPGWDPLVRGMGSTGVADEIGFGQQTVDDLVAAGYSMRHANSSMASMDEYSISLLVRGGALLVRVRGTVVGVGVGVGVRPPHE